MLSRISAKRLVSSQNLSRLNSCQMAKRIEPCHLTRYYSTQIFQSKSTRIYNFFKYALGAGVFGITGFVGFVGYKIYEESRPVDQEPQSATFPNGEKRKTLVILGSGWGAIPMLKNLDTTLYNVVLVSPRNYFLFTPLLPSVPTGTIEMKSIMEPVRSISRRCKGEVRYLEAEAIDIDPENNLLTVQQSTTVYSGHSNDSSSATDISKHREHKLERLIETISYDYLVVSIGAQPSTFGLPGVAEHSTFVKEVSDSARIKKKLTDLVEAANMLHPDDKERRRLLHIIVCGGGPTGVEAAGEIQDYIDQDLKKWVPEVAKDLRVTLVESQPKVLHTFNPKLVEYTNQVFKETNINLMTNTRITKVDDQHVTAYHKENGKSEIVPYGMLIWATGNSVRSFTSLLMSKIDKQKTAKRGLLVDDYLKVIGSDNIYALGDCTFTKYPPTAQVAYQEGQYLAAYFDKLQKLASLKYRIEHEQNPGEFLIHRAKKLEENLPKFVYHYQGSLAYIGSEKAVADLAWGSWSNVSTGGNMTFLFWRSAYIYMCLSVKNQVMVCMDWVKVYLFGRDCS